MAHPHLPSCADCQAWFFDMKTGQRTPWRGGWLKRSEGDPPPCGNCPKCPAGEAANPDTGKRSELTAANYQAYRHFLETRGALTEEEKTDSIVRRNRGIIENLLMRQQSNSGADVISMMLPLLLKR